MFWVSGSRYYDHGNTPISSHIGGPIYSRWSRVLLGYRRPVGMCWHLSMMLALCLGCWVDNLTDFRSISPMFVHWLSTWFLIHEAMVGHPDFRLFKTIKWTRMNFDMFDMYVYLCVLSVLIFMCNYVFVCPQLSPLHWHRCARETFWKSSAAPMCTRRLICFKKSCQGIW